MATDNRRLILANGEALVGKTEKTGHSRPSPLPRSYDDARDRVVEQLKSTLAKATALDRVRKYQEEVFLCFRLHPDMLAKTYEPESLFIEVPDLKKVGSRNWRPSLDEVAQTERVIKQKAGQRNVVGLGRLIFVQGVAEGFNRFLGKLDISPRLLTESFREDIQKIERVDLLTKEEQFQGFGSDWKNGRVELVLHPSRAGQDRQLSFLAELFAEISVPKNKYRTALYPAGPGFISAFLTKESLNQLVDCNPLRTAHPLNFQGLPSGRSSNPIKAPPPPAGELTRSTIKVGVLDGGVDMNCPHLKGFVEDDIALAIKTKPMAPFVEHGTKVVGAVLYGSLDKYDPSKPLPQPPVSVVSIRAFPPSNAGDPDLFECIDVIENAVPRRPDISIYNISFGPVGPIRDDLISRFTYALDHLTITQDVLFFVAVGNSGDDPKYHRIQSPSDLVHGIGVGAYTIRGGTRMRAPYSCKGPGREGAKIKPDFLAFGGCDVLQMHLLSTTPGMKILDIGTSYASPVAASLGAQVNGLFDRGTPLLTRVLLTHCADHPKQEADHEIGHGYLAESVESILNCTSTSVTIAYQGNLVPKSYSKLLIPLPDGLSLPGKVKISWTIAAMCPIEFDHPGDYTGCCIEDTFYPHSEVFSFGLGVKGKTTEHKKLNLRTDKDAVAALGKQWKQSQFPAPKSGNVYPKTEQEKREYDYKWDTIVRRSVSMLTSSIHKPFIVLHAIGRHAEVNTFPYAAAVTISAPQYAADLHNEIVRRFPVLQPIRIKTESEIRIRV